MNISAPIRDHARRVPDATAFVAAEGEPLSYAAFDAAVDHVAVRLLGLGLVPRQIAILASPDLYRYLVVALALARIGVAHAPDMIPASFADVALVDGATKPLEGVSTVMLEQLWPREARVLPSAVRMHEGGGAIV